MLSKSKNKLFPPVSENYIFQCLLHTPRDWGIWNLYHTTLIVNHCNIFWLRSSSLPLPSYPALKFINCDVWVPSNYVVATASQTSFAVGKQMKFATSGWSIELINHPFTREFSVCRLPNVGFVSEGWGKSPLIYRSCRWLRHTSQPPRNINHSWCWSALWKSRW